MVSIPQLPKGAMKYDPSFNMFDKRLVTNRKNVRKRQSSDNESESDPEKVAPTQLAAKPKKEHLLGIPFTQSGTAASLVVDAATRILDVDATEHLAEVVNGDQAEALDKINTYAGLRNYKVYSK
jgi:hypothetical protein